MGKARKSKHALLAAELLTQDGVTCAMAGIYDRLAHDDLTRDQATPLIGARRVLEWFAKERHDCERTREHDELIEELRRTREAMRSRGGGQTSFEDDPLQAADRAGSVATEH